MLTTKHLTLALALTLIEEQIRKYGPPGGEPEEPVCEWGVCKWG